MILPLDGKLLSVPMDIGPILTSGRLVYFKTLSP